MPNDRDPLIRGTLTALILKSLSWGALHGYGIARWVQKQSADVLQVDEGVLYPALHRLEKEGMLDANWGRNDTGRRAKFYSLTARGRAYLEAEMARWRRSSDAVNAVLDASEA